MNSKIKLTILLTFFVFLLFGVNKSVLAADVCTCDINNQPAPGDTCTPPTTPKCAPMPGRGANFGYRCSCVNSAPGPGPASSNTGSVSLPTYPGATFKFANGTIGDVISALILYIYVAAGLSMLVVLIMGGLTLMTAAGDQAKVKDGYGKITAAIIGFLIVFVSYFAVQIAEVVLGVKIF